MSIALRSIVWVLVILGVSVSSSAQDAKKWAIAIHGGAGGDPAELSPELHKARLQVLERVLKAGVDSLKAGKSGVSVVQQVVMLLEDAPEFNAGKGAVFNSVGEFELDASIMDGRTKACGAVSGVRRIKNPIGAALLVMQKTRHVLLMGAGAERFAESQGVEMVDNDYFWTDRHREMWAKSKKDKAAAENETESKGTVGCVVLDSEGNLAAGTSTGGVTLKMPGRVGDSPIIGAGTYADNATCAVSCTGTGEEYIRHAIAFHISARIEYANDSVTDAVKYVLTKRLKPGDGGIIAIGKDGEITLQYSTKGMAQAAADSKGRFDFSLGK